MLEIGGGLDLLYETIGPKYRGEFGAEYLHGDLAVVFDVVRQVHRRHAAGAEFVLDGVAVGEGGLQAGKGVRHRRVPLA